MVQALQMMVQALQAAGDLIGCLGQEVPFHQLVPPHRLLADRAAEVAGHLLHAQVAQH